MARRIWTLCCAIWTLLCLVFFPGELEPVKAESYLLRTRPEFQGVLTIWQVSAWRTVKLSRETVLREAAARFEAENPGIYVEILEMDWEDYERALARGECPDLLSHGGGIPHPVGEKMSLSADIWDGIVYDEKEGLPWMATVGMVMTAPGEGQWVSPAWQECLMGAELKVEVPESEREALRRFEAEGGILYGGMFEAGNLSEGKRSAVQLFPWPKDLGKAVRCQYLTAFETKVPARGDAVKSLVQEILGEKTQSRAARGCGVLPAVLPGDFDPTELQKAALEFLAG